MRQCLIGTLSRSRIMLLLEHRGRDSSRPRDGWPECPSVTATAAGIILVGMMTPGLGLRRITRVRRPAFRRIRHGSGTIRADGIDLARMRLDLDGLRNLTGLAGRCLRHRSSHYGRLYGNSDGKGEKRNHGCSHGYTAHGEPSSIGYGKINRHDVAFVPSPMPSNSPDALETTVLSQCNDNIIPSYNRGGTGCISGQDRIFPIRNIASQN